MSTPTHRLSQSFRAALRGLSYTFRAEQNFRFQLVASVAVLIVTALLPLRNWEIIVVALLVMLVLIMELLNTAVERVMDLLKPRLHQYVLLIKDVMAGAVLLTSLAALVIGSIIFVPHFIALLK